jgi:hypothetical protein
MNLTQYIGDSKTHAIPLTWEGAAFSPGDDWALIFTLKRKTTDEDSAAVIQKTSGAGITVVGNIASVELLPADTVSLSATGYSYDIQAQDVISGAVRTVTTGRIILTRDITRATETSIPVISTNPPLPFGPVFTITAGDELEIVSGGITYYVPLYRRP